MENWPALQQAFGLGLDPKDYTLLQISLRALVVYIGGLLILRLGKNRFLGKETAFDIIVGFVLGSVLSRAINGNSPLFLSLAAAALFVALHRVSAYLSFRSHRFGRLFKGKPGLLIRDGRMVDEALAEHRLTRHDIEEALRIKGHLDDPAKVREAWFERNGEISVLPRSGEPKVVEVRVHEGVQTVRIEIG